jgi:hypothetical protein
LAAEGYIKEWEKEVQASDHFERENPTEIDG